MPNPPLPESLHDLLAKPNPAVIATVRPDGQPVSVATWYLYEDGRFLVNMAGFRARLEHLRKDPRVSLTVLSADSWYTHVSVQGRIASLVDDPDNVDIDRIATHYTGRPYASRDQARVSAWIDVDHWHGWSGGKPLG